MTHILRVLGSLPLVVMLAASLGLANAAQIQLNSAAPFLCVTVGGGNTAPGTPVIANSCSGGPEDQWQFINSQFQGLGTANGVSTCLDLQGGAFAPGTLVVLNTCSGAQSQQWNVDNGAWVFNYTSQSFTYIDFVNWGIGLCLDSSGGPSVGGGTQLVINPCANTKSQNWIVRDMQLQASPGPPYLCATVQGNKTASGTPVISSACNGGPGQLWDFQNGVIYGVGTENGEHKCLTASGPSGTVTLSTCNSSQLGQQWTIGGQRFTSLVSDSYTGCVDSAGGPSVTGGTQLILLDYCPEGATEDWNVR